MVNSSETIPTQISEIVKLVQKLPKLQKQKLVEILLQNDFVVSEQQKKMVQNRILFYDYNPDKLISEQDAWKQIDG